MNDTDIKNKINQKAPYICKIIEKHSDGKKESEATIPVTPDSFSFSYNDPLH